LLMLLLLLLLLLLVTSNGTSPLFDTHLTTSIACLSSAAPGRHLTAQ
jgi:hypothetical protein